MNDISLTIVEDEGVAMSGSFGSGASGFLGGPAGMREAVEQLFGGFDKRVSMRMGRGDVRTAVLLLLAEGPMHGYQIIHEIEERSGGAWKPSPGSVYPTLQLLTDEGLLRAEESNGRKTYALTETGVEQADAAAEGTAPWEVPGSATAAGRARFPRRAWNSRRSRRTWPARATPRRCRARSRCSTRPGVSSIRSSPRTDIRVPTARRV